MSILGSIVSRLARAVGPRAEFELHLLRMRRYGWLEREWYLLDLLCRPGGTALDVGANAGIYASALSRIARQVIAFEANPELAAKLLPKLRRNVIVRSVALSNTAGRATLRIPISDRSEIDGLATLEQLDDPFLQVPQRGGDTRIREMVIETCILDSLALDDVSFIKIDVEGHEFAVVEGGRATIERNRPVVLVETQKITNPHEPERIFGFFGGIGYQGIFFRSGLATNVAEFRPERDQAGDPRDPRYVNNFIFLPEAPAPSLVERLQARVSDVETRRKRTGR